MTFRAVHVHLLCSGANHLQPLYAVCVRCTVDHDVTNVTDVTDNLPGLPPNQVCMACLGCLLIHLAAQT
jgi:hypothetical protein